MAFNLGDVLKGVSNLDTMEERIQKVRLDQIEDDPDNFYQLTGIEELADNIATCGLMDPIRVRPDPEEEGRYIIVSGHRRRSAVALLAKDDSEKWSEISCIVETGDASPALQQLRLIYANCNTRVLSSAEMSQQVQQVEKLLYELKEDGYDFPGRMRDHVAEACQVSKTKIARLKVIREKLASCWMKLYENGTLKESSAYALARMPVDWQVSIQSSYTGNVEYMSENQVKKYADAFKVISEIACPDSMAPCENTTAMRRRMVATNCSSWDACKGCCLECDNLRTCKYSCYQAQQKKKDLQTKAKVEKAFEKQQQAAKEKPAIEFVTSVFSRVGSLRKEKNLSVKDIYHAAKVYWSQSDDQKEIDRENGKDITAHTGLPFGYHFEASDAQHLCAVADLLGCSIDYLLGRTEDPSWPVSNPDTKEDPKPLQPVSSSDTWHYDDPKEPGQYCLMYHSDYWGDDYLCGITWSGGQWIGLDQEADDAEPICWTYMPGKEKG